LDSGLRVLEAAQGLDPVLEVGLSAAAGVWNAALFLQSSLDGGAAAPFSNGR